MLTSYPYKILRAKKKTLILGCGKTEVVGQVVVSFKGNQSEYNI